MKRQIVYKIMAVFLCIAITLSGNACSKKQGKEIDDTQIKKEQVESSKIEENREKKEAEEKIIVNLYTDSFDCKEFVDAFNRQSEKYQIEITIYQSQEYYKDEDWEEIIERTKNSNGRLAYHQPEEVMERDIKNERQPEPDILYWTDSGLIKRYGRKGYLEDLLPMLGKERELYKKDILEASMINGELYQLPETFYFYVLIGNKKMMGDKNSWTMEEMQSLYDGLSESFMYMMDITKERFIGDAFSYQQSDFIESRSGEFHVETKDFINILKFAKQLPNEEADIYCSSKWTKEKMIPKGQLLLQRGPIGDEESISYYQKRYQEVGGYNILSYPSIENDGLLIDVMMFPFAIPKDSKNKEAAWELIQFVVNEHIKSVEEDRHDTRFFCQKRLLKESLKRYKKENRRVVKSLLKRIGRIRTRYDFDYLGSSDKESEEIVHIIVHNAEKYFRGKETVEEAAKTIQRKLEKWQKQRDN